MARCTVCQRRLSFGECYLRLEKRALCTACADLVSVDALMALTERETPRGMLLSLGFEWDAQ